MTTTATRHESLYRIAYVIEADWANPYFGAVPYIEAMGSLDQITDTYGCDPAREIVLYFLGNASSWRGPVARDTKAQLKKIAGLK